MCNTIATLIESMYYMNTGTPKPSERFYRAQINGGWTCEKRFQEYADLIGIDHLPGFMMFTRTAPQFANGNQMQYVCVFIHNTPHQLATIANQLLRVPYYYEVYCVSYSTDHNNWNLYQNYEYGPQNQNLTANICQPDFTFTRFDSGLNAFVPETQQNFLSNFAVTNWRVGRTIRSTLAEYTNYFGQLNFDQMQALYAERFFLQVLLRQYSAPMQDFDIFVSINGSWHLSELKQKDANVNGGIRRFGWDAHRLALYLYVIHHTGFGGTYIISELNNQQQRAHLQWLCITIEDMLQNLNWGGVRNGTLMLPATSFNVL